MRIIPSPSHMSTPLCHHDLNLDCQTITGRGYGVCFPGQRADEDSGTKSSIRLADAITIALGRKLPRVKSTCAIFDHAAQSEYTDYVDPAVPVVHMKNSTSSSRKAALGLVPKTGVVNAYVEKENPVQRRQLALVIDQLRQTRTLTALALQRREAMHKELVGAVRALNRTMEQRQPVRSKKRSVTVKLERAAGGDDDEAHSDGSGVVIDPWKGKSPSLWHRYTRRWLCGHAFDKLNFLVSDEDFRKRLEEGSGQVIQCRV